MILCDYGCGQEAKYQFKNGKWCCEDNYNKCEKIKEKRSNILKGKVSKLKGKKSKITITSYEGNELCSYGCGRIAKYKYKNGNYSCEVSFNKCPEMIKANSERLKNKPYEELYGKEKALEMRKKRSKKLKGKDYNILFGEEKAQQLKKNLSIFNKRTIKKIKKKFPLFSKIEEMRYNPDKPKEKEIQVHCKNHLCPNSKEQGGWFTPSTTQINERIRCIEISNKDNSYFYCSDECKNQCPLFGLNPIFELNKLKQNEFLYSREEYTQFREYVLKRDNYECQYCGEKAEHVHHERPQKLEPFHALDPDLAWSVCSKCHYEKGHKDQCSTGVLSNIICNN